VQLDRATMDAIALTRFTQPSKTGSNEAQPNPASSGNPTPRSNGSTK
jgi:hypothetical protein